MGGARGGDWMGAVGGEVGVAVVVGEAGQLQSHRELHQDVAAVVVMMATIVVMKMVALFVRMRHRCRSALVAKSA